MKEEFRKTVQRNPADRFVRGFLRRVNRRLQAYLCHDETLFLRHLDRNKQWEIGEYSYGHPSQSPKVVHFGETAKLKIGNFCSFAEDVWIVFGGYHRTDWITTYPFSVLFDGAEETEGIPSAKGDIVIGNDVWVCTGATILAGVTVGDGAVIAARSVVTKDVEPYTVVAGNPARPVRKRFSDAVIAQLEEIAWWDWPIEKIKAEFPLLLSGNVEEFVAKHGRAPVSEELTDERTAGHDRHTDLQPSSLFA